MYSFELILIYSLSIFLPPNKVMSDEIFVSFEAMTMAQT